jgi:hypothetical protein
MGPAADKKLVDGDEGWTAETDHAAMNRLLSRRPEFLARVLRHDLLAIGAPPLSPNALCASLRMAA